MDGTDFGSVLLNQTNDHVFTIQNLGSADLDLTDDPRVTVTGTDFTLLSDAATPVVAGNSTTFTVRFVPTALTTRLGTVSIAHNDNTDGENPYTFAIKGTCDTLLFTTAAPGAYDANATWTGGTTNPANGTADVVTLNHAVYVTSANHTANDALTVAAGGSLEARGVNPNAASLNLSAGNASLLSDASPRTITLNAATGARLALGGGSLTTVAKGALVGNNVAFGATLNAQSATTTILSGSHTFDVANNGTGLGTLTLSQRVNSQTASDALVKTGTGQLTLSAGANFAAGDLLDMQGGSLNLGADCGAGGAIRFSGSGQTLYPNSITLASDLDAQTAVAIDAIGGSGNNPTFNGKFTGSGTITLLGGQYRQIVNAAAGSTWNGTLILGTGGRAGVDVRSAYLTPSLVTLCGASGFTDPPIASDSVSTAFLRVETPILTVGGMSTTGNGINTRIGSRGTGVTRTLRVNVADSLSYDYAGMLANNIPGDTSILALVKTGSGTQTLSGQTYLSNYSGGTTVSNGTLVVNGGGAAVTKTTTSASVGNGSTGNFTIADTTGLYVGKPVTGFTDVFISAIVGTTVTVCNRSGASATIPATVTFGATSPTGSGAVAVRNGAGLRAAGRIGGGLVVEDGATFELGAGAATLSVGGNATFAGSAQLTFDLSSSAGGANDTVVMDGTSAVLSGNGGNIGINCGATLDKTADYVLFDLTGAGASVASGFSGQPLWVSGTPDDAGRFVIRAEGKQIVLHFTYGTVIELR